MQQHAHAARGSKKQQRGQPCGSSSQLNSTASRHTTKLQYLCWKVKAHHSRGQQCQQQPSAGQPVQPEQPEQERAPDLKRPRFEVIDRANAADGVAAVPASASAKQPVAAAGTSCSISSQQQDRSRAAASGETATTSRKHHDTQAAGQLQQQGQPRSRQEERGHTGPAGVQQ
ncbi:hypothetical protein COO60DRAFT_854839 [Scenedesmus sp. NREL 46B-D3]|nr:hypothetical protein COO60DRAFT_854839 [Scenedesmus sp. NREL 46B-D3]